MAVVYRLLGSDEKLLLQEGLRPLDPLICDYDNEVRRRRYFHLFKHEQTSDLFSEELGRRFSLFATQLRGELLAASLLEPTDLLTHYGYMVSFPGAPAQDWHVDYDGDVVIVYIPLTEETEKNATQYLLQRDGYSLAVQFLNRSADEIPIICTPRQSTHRGISNQEPFRRVVFYLMYSRPDWESLEPLFVSTSRLAVNVDVDADSRFRAELKAGPRR